MNQIERYIFRRIFVLSIGTLVVTTVLAMTTQILLYVNLLTSTGQSLLAYATLAVMLMPKVMVIVMPFALLIGAANTLSGMNEDSELVVIEAAGSPPRSISRPIMLIAGGMAVFTLISNNYIEPAANRQVGTIVSNARGDLLSSAIQTGEFTRLDKNVYFNVENVGAGSELHGIFISDGRDPSKTLTYYARTGQLVRTAKNQLLVLADGQVQSEDNGGKVSIVAFKTYALDLSLFPGTDAGNTYDPKEDSTAYLFNPDPKDHYYKSRPEAFVEQIHKRFSEWLYPLLFGLIAIAFMGRAYSSRGDRMQYDILAFLVALFFRGAGFYVRPESGGSVVFAVLTYAVPVFGIALHAYLVLADRRVSLSRSWPEALTSVYERISALFARRARARGEGGPT